MNFKVGDLVSIYNLSHGTAPPDFVADFVGATALIVRFDGAAGDYRPGRHGTDITQWVIVLSRGKRLYMRSYELKKI